MGRSPSEVKVVQEMLGHTSITLTMDTYSHVLPGMQEESAARMRRWRNGEHRGQRLPSQTMPSQLDVPCNEVWLLGGVHRRFSWPSAQRTNPENAIVFDGCG